MGKRADLLRSACRTTSSAVAVPPRDECGERGGRERGGGERGGVQRGCSAAA